MASPLVRVLATVLLALSLGACGLVSSTPPPATPTDFPGLAGRFNSAGITVSNWVTRSLPAATTRPRTSASTSTSSATARPSSGTAPRSGRVPPPS
jgi:hypothetical protein